MNTKQPTYQAGGTLAQLFATPEHCSEIERTDSWMSRCEEINRQLRYPNPGPTATQKCRNCYWQQ